jgi:hypothetical protein
MYNAVREQVRASRFHALAIRFTCASFTGSAMQADGHVSLLNSNRPAKSLKLVNASLCFFSTP